MRPTIILALILILTGCVTERRCNEKFPPAVISADSTVENSYLYDQDSSYITKMPGDSSWIKLYIECNEYGQALIRQVEGYKAGQKVGVPEVQITGHILTAKCEVDSLEVYNRIKKTFKSDTAFHGRKAEGIKYINRLTTSQRNQIAAFWIESALMIIIISFFIKRKLFS